MKLRGVLPLAMMGIGLSVPATALSVCLDPDYLPYSNQAGEGFENKIALAVGNALREKVQFTWASHRGHGGFPQFLSSTLDAGKCEVVMSIPYGSREELTTRPYYISSYVFVFPKNKKYDVTSMDSPLLKRLKVGFERETPAEDALKMRGLITGPGGVVGFDVSDEGGGSPEVMLTALKNGEIDVLVTWQPAISSFLKAYPDFEGVTIPNTRALGAPEQYSFPMSMAVRQGNDALKKRLDEVIEQHQAELTSILKENGVLVSF